MQWRHTFRHIDPSQSLQEYAESCFEKSGRLLLKDSTWHVHYSKGKHNDRCVEVSVQNGTGYFKASSHCDDFYQAVDECAEKLSKQFQKKKERLKSHKAA